MLYELRSGILQRSEYVTKVGKATYALKTED